MVIHSNYTALCFGALILVAGCKPDAPPASFSPGARPEMVEMLRQDISTERHPADGGGRAWLEGESTGGGRAVAGEPGRWTIVYEAGPLGIVEGGFLFLQISPFWGWSTPQVANPEAPGFTQVTTAAPGVELAPATLDQQLLGIRIGGRGLESGERVRIVYGAGVAGARADFYAERRSPFWISVDGDADGVRGLVADSPTVEVGPGPPALLLLTLPSTARPGEEVRLTVALVDRVGNSGVVMAGEVVLDGTAGGLPVPGTLSLRREDAGRKSVTFLAREPGVYRLEGRFAPAPGSSANELRGSSNPLVVSSGGQRVLWGDLHGHSNLSDGTGTPEDYFRYARDVASLDVVALTDHDHWGMQPLARSPDLWREIELQTRAFHAPRRFVTLLGYEWTSWIHGHRHVLYFGDQGQVLSSVDPDFESPLQLWAALRGQEALTFAHHSAGGPIATNWEIPPDPELEPVTEIVSVHGSSEAADSPGGIYNAVRGNFVRDALERGYELGFIGSGDSHDGHPGLTHLASRNSGLAGILSSELTRKGVLEALQARRVYATNGPRILLEVSLGGRAMGAYLSAADLAADSGDGEDGAELVVRVVAPQPIERMDLIRSGKLVASLPGRGQTELRWRHRVNDLQADEYVYVRVVQRDGGAAWSSPFFVRP